MNFSSEALQLELVQSVKIVNFSIVAAAALHSYETLITTNQEITHIWRSRWSLVKVLYILARYPPLMYLLLNAFVVTNAFLGQPFCNKYIHFEVLGAWSFLPVVDALIAIRVHSIYERRKKMGIFLFLLWIVETACGVILPTLALKGFTAVPNFLPGVFTGCVTTRIPDYKLALSFWAIASGFQAICVTMTLYKLVGFVQDFGFRLTPMVNIFFRDGTLYFLVILSADLLNMFSERYSTLIVQETVLIWTVSSISIASCRMVLNLRESAASSSLGMMGPTLDDISRDMSFLNRRRRWTDTIDSMIL